MKPKKLFIIFIVGILILLSLNIFQKEVRNIFYLVSSPFQKFLWRAGEKTSSFFEALVKVEDFKKEAEELRLKNQELLQKLIALKKLKEENQILREALNVGLEKDFRLLLVNTIEKDIGEDSILIDKGFQEGVAKDMPVITSQKVVVGKVKEVYKHFSKVTLISNREISFPVFIEKEEGERKIEGMAKGKGRLALYVDLIPINEKIKPGDIVVTCALGGIFPENLLVGRLEEIKKSDVEPFQRAEIKPAFDIRALENLFIITEY